MRDFFSVRTLLVISTIFASLLSIYILFLIGPYLTSFFQVIRAVLVPFIISMIFAYLLIPLVDILMKCKLNRSMSILVLFILFMTTISILIWKGIPIFMTQVKEVIEELPMIEATLQTWFLKMDQQLSHLPDSLHQGIDDAISNFEINTRNVMGEGLEVVSGFIGNFFTLIVVPFLVFYLLKDVDIFQKTFYYLIPKGKRKLALQLWKDIDHSLAEYIRGQIVVSLLVGVLAFLGYFFIDLPYALFLAVFVAITNIIPYFGPFIGAAPALLVALITDPSLLLWIIVINTTIQVIEGNLLAPWIVGKRLHIHPVFIIFSLLIGAEIGGFIGLILAVPIFVVVKVIVLHTAIHVRRRRETQIIDRSE